MCCEYCTSQWRSGREGGLAQPMPILVDATNYRISFPYLWFHWLNWYMGLNHVGNSRGRDSLHCRLRRIFAQWRCDGGLVQHVRWVQFHWNRKHHTLWYRKGMSSCTTRFMRHGNLAFAFTQGLFSFLVVALGGVFVGVLGGFFTGLVTRYEVGQIFHYYPCCITCKWLADLPTTSAPLRPSSWLCVPTSFTSSPRYSIFPAS